MGLKSSSMRVVKYLFIIIVFIINIMMIVLECVVHLLLFESSGLAALQCIFKNYKASSQTKNRTLYDRTSMLRENC